LFLGFFLGSYEKSRNEVTIVRRVFLLSCLSSAMLIPSRHCVFATEGTGEEIEVQLPRRISPSKEGHLLCASREEKLRVVFGDGGQDWAFERKDGKWLIRQSGIPRQTSFGWSNSVTRRVCGISNSNSWIRETTVPEGAMPARHQGRFGAGLWKLASPSKSRDGFVLSRSVTLQKDKSPLALLRLWVDGP
jgi:hypothetical protein